MPELPEVETSKQGITPHIRKQKIEAVDIRERRLRWPIPRAIEIKLVGQTIRSIDRRGKYILLSMDRGTIIIHLGMSGSLKICETGNDYDKHDHIDIRFSNRKILRFRDPRKFGCFLWTEKNPLHHKLLISLGPEPLSSMFDVDYLYALTRNRGCSIKSLIMNSNIVVGVGNIYACESLFRARINPKRKASNISRSRIEKLVHCIKTTLQSAIECGGTTLKDFTREDGKPGYFSQELYVYGREGQPCLACDKSIRRFVQNQRSTFYCPSCQR